MEGPSLSPAPNPRLDRAKGEREAWTLLEQQSNEVKMSLWVDSAGSILD